MRFTRLGSGNFQLLSDGMQLIITLLLVGLGLAIAYKSIHTLFFEKGNKEEKTAALQY
ncbi:MAG: hypothetical protein JEY71_12320 [Sphaerochaeta sp.]|nr:hypothetical protein [Sphaerochaeta sp.]